jgi:hypothetical protein
MTAQIINISPYLNKKLRGKRHRTRALGTKPLEQEPDSNGASPAPKRDNLEIKDG